MEAVLEARGGAALPASAAALSGPSVAPAAAVARTVVRCDAALWATLSLFAVCSGGLVCWGLLLIRHHAGTLGCSWLFLRVSLLFTPMDEFCTCTPKDDFASIEHHVCAELILDKRACTLHHTSKS